MRFRVHLGIWGPFGSEWFVAITATNVGRMPTAVHAMGFELPNGKIVIAPDSHVNTTRVPQRLEPGQEVSFWFDPKVVRRECARAGIDPRVLRPVARSAQGETKGRLKQAALTLIEQSAPGGGATRHR